MAITEKLGWFVVNLTDKKRGACPGILIWSKVGLSDYDTYYPEIELELTQDDGEDGAGFFVSRLSVSNPGGAKPEQRELVYELYRRVLDDDPDSMGMLVDKLREILHEGEPGE